MEKACLINEIRSDELINLLPLNDEQIMLVYDMLIEDLDEKMSYEIFTLGDEDIIELTKTEVKIFGLRAILSYSDNKLSKVINAKKLLVENVKKRNKLLNN